MRKHGPPHGGGARVGAGRPTGSRNKTTINREALSNETVVKLVAAGISNTGALAPSDIAALNAIEVMSYAMTSEAVAGRWLVAAEIAAKIAPYRFAKMQHVTTVATIRRIDDLSDAELSALAVSDEEPEEGDT